MTDIVYILGKGTVWQDNELLFSIRSIVKHGKNVGNIFIVGEEPVKQRDVIHLPCTDPYIIKNQNAWYKLRKTCTALDKPFVLMNDDFYLCKDFDFDTVPMYKSGTIQDLVDKYKGIGEYAACHMRAITILQSLGKPIINYALHTPISVNPIPMRQWFKDLGNKPGVSFRNMYANLIKEGREEIEMEDVKVLKPFNTEEEFYEYIEDKPLFSICNTFFNEIGKKVLRDLYGSEYNKYDGSNYVV